MTITRDLEPALRRAARENPVVTVIGPRQSGKTTLCRSVFPDHAYVSLEPLDNRAYAREDPRGFLAEYAHGAVMDEVQNTPELVSYLHEVVDSDPSCGRFVLTGSENLALTQSVAQTLAGRTAMLRLLPCSWAELTRFDAPPADLMSALWMGSYPRIHDRGLHPARWLADYTATYVERDVRQVLRVVDLTTFSTFLRLVAGRTGAVLNLNAMGSDAGITQPTAKAWLSVLEATFVVQRVPAWHKNRRKRWTKSPKLHMVDTGLACHLLGIRTAEELLHHPLRGNLFESWVVGEVHKAWRNVGAAPPMYHLRTSQGLESDLLVETPGRTWLAEVKSGATPSRGVATTLGRVAEAMGVDPVIPRLVYGGEMQRMRSAVQVVPWTQCGRVDWGQPSMA